MVEQCYSDVYITLPGIGCKTKRAAIATAPERLIYYVATVGFISIFDVKVILV